MNLFLGGGSLASLMKPHFYKKISIKQILRSQLRQNIFWASSRATALQHEIVQRSMAQLNEHNHEELDSIYTRPTLDLYLCNKYWNFITADQSKEEISDLEDARKRLEHYEKLYSFMEYCSDLSGIVTTMTTRIAGTNPSLPQSMYRRSRHNSNENLFSEVEQCLDAYYGIIDDCTEQHPEWVKKVEEEIGSNMAFLFTAFDDSVRDDLVARSKLFERFDLEKQKFFK